MAKRRDDGVVERRAVLAKEVGKRNVDEFRPGPLCGFGENLAASSLRIGVHGSIAHLGGVGVHHDGRRVLRGAKRPRNLLCKSDVAFAHLLVGAAVNSRDVKQA